MGKDEFTDEIPTSAVLGLQLNDPILQLDIGTLDRTNSSECNNRLTNVFQLSVPEKHVTALPPLPAWPSLDSGITD